MGKMKHKNITEIYEIQKIEDIVLIFMEYVPNGTIADFIHAHKMMPEFIAKPILAQLVEAVFYLHTKNIAHRDLKVENILLDKGMNPKLTDFSYTTFVKFDEKTKEVVKTKTCCGSVVYLPPEILNEREYDPRQADIWSFGVCIYVMLNNAIPFKVSNMQEYKHKQQNKEWSFKSYVNISKDLKDIVARMMEPDPAKRITSKDLLLHPYFMKK
ncbi:testis-specific serine/threonine-protein kinase 2-like isoform X1 [Leptotrombidium deliense]|uniref:Testis-specific serine/threonine-protein kinase 2-like isoform X1 n=1 Tax=Leptotrombidium deliense TaxID=299467 RepID=A0A443RU34_9ACAR|nr:testis-specific serine/threonine-protein kinase 2-like isoform X1 [Leptotrombidium deliense]